MLVKDFIRQYPGASFDMMMPGGFVFLTAGQAKDLLAGNGRRGHPGDPASAITIPANELLSEQMVRADWEGNVCHMLTDYVQEEEQAADRNEVKEMGEQEKERKLKERIKANYEAYIQQLKAKSAPDLIEMATEISAFQFVYTELSAEGAYREHLDYLLQFENPLEAITNSWLDHMGYDYHEELEFLLQDKADRWMENGCPAMEDASAGALLEQGVAMC